MTSRDQVSGAPLKGNSSKDRGAVKVRMTSFLSIWTVDSYLDSSMVSSAFRVSEPAGPFRAVPVTIPVTWTR